MKTLHIFKAGRHTASCGATLSFDEAALQATAAAYDPALHEAPIVVGHPAGNGPAFGWIKGLQFVDGDLHAEPHQVNPDFEALVQQGAYKKISASFYGPDAPANPAPGTYYLRHVGFLGAQPPAIKGLQAIGFDDGEAGIVTVDFGGAGDPDYATGAAAILFRNLREWLLGKHGKEDADAVVPGYLIADIEDAARAPAPPLDTPASTPIAYSEDHPMPMTPEQIAAAEAELADRQDRIAAQEADFAERQARITATEQAIALAEVAARIDALVAQGKVLPAEKPRLVSFMASLSDADDQLVEFTEDGQTQRQSPRAVLQSLLDALPNRVDFAERSGPGVGTPNIGNPSAIAARAVAYQQEQAKAGVHLSFTTAVNAVSKA